MFFISKYIAWRIFEVIYNWKSLYCYWVIEDQNIQKPLFSNIKNCFLRNDRFYIKKLIGHFWFELSKENEEFFLRAKNFIFNFGDKNVCLTFLQKYRRYSYSEVQHTLEKPGLIHWPQLATAILITIILNIMSRKGQYLASAPWPRSAHTLPIHILKYQYFLRGVAPKTTYENHQFRIKVWTVSLPQSIELIWFYKYIIFFLTNIEFSHWVRERGNRKCAHRTRTMCVTHAQHPATRSASWRGCYCIGLFAY